MIARELHIALLACLLGLAFVSDGELKAQSTATEVAKLLASDRASNDLSGFSIAVDGDTAVVGAYLHEHSGSVWAGAAYVYVRTNGNWSDDPQMLTASDYAAADQFGFSVDIDEDTIVVGANGKWNGLEEDRGAAYVFTRNFTGVWTEEDKLLASDGVAYDSFGESVAVNGDTVLVGARSADGASTNTGAAYVYVRTNDCGSVWCEEDKLAAADGAGTDYFGSSVDLDGDTAVIGAPLDDHLAEPNENDPQDEGSVYVFTRSAGVWSEAAKLTATDAGSGDNLGGSVAKDGDTIVAGASRNDGAGDDAGAAYVFRRVATVWSEQEDQKLTAGEIQATDRFGMSVAIDSDYLLVGAHLAEEGGGPTNAGAVYVFSDANVSCGLSWCETGRLLASDAMMSDALGQAVALSGTVAVAGAPFDDDTMNTQDEMDDLTNTGAAYVFDTVLPTFGDVSSDYWAFSFIETLSQSGITAGCGGGKYCPEGPVTRAQMAVFLERGMKGSDYAPPAATGSVFLDVEANDFAAAFIEQFFIDGITGGCGANNYCPNDPVTRAQMAVFLLRAKHGSGYMPPVPTGVFGDVGVGYWSAAWIEQLASEGITSGCGGVNYCPEESVTRAQMAVFLVRTFGL